MDSTITDITSEVNEITEMPAVQSNNQQAPMNIIQSGHYTNKMLDQNINFGSNYNDDFSQMDMVIDSYSSNNQNQVTMSPPSSQNQNIVDVNSQQKQNFHKSSNRYLRNSSLKPFM